MLKIDDLLKQPGGWLAPGEDNGIVISSRVRLARNLQGRAFPGWAGEEECARIWQDLLPVLRDCKSLSQPLYTEMVELNGLDKQVLFERNLISREHAQKKKGSGLILRKDERMGVMVNEEDHLRLQAMEPGLNVTSIWKRIDRFDTEIEKKARYAFSAKIGYLTACPSNVGTGMRASVLLRVPGLVMMNEINAVVRGLAKIGLAIRGLWGEGSEAAGNMFQVSNQMTLGEREEDIASNLEQIVLEIVEHELNARVRLMETQEDLVRDRVGRALGILSGAHILSSKESLDLLSDLRLGSDLGILTAVDGRTIDQLIILTQPAHLQKVEGKKLNVKDRDMARARLVRKRIEKAMGGAR